YGIGVNHAQDCAWSVEEMGGTNAHVRARAAGERSRGALVAASPTVAGGPPSAMVGFPRRRDSGEQRLPSGQRTMLWVKRNLPSASGAVLERARRYYEDSPAAK